MSRWGDTGATLGEMIVAQSQPAPPQPVAPPPAPVIPNTAGEATARLNELKADPAWRDEFLAGGSRQAREMASLLEVIDKGENPRVDRAMAGVMADQPFQEQGHLAMIGATDMLRSAGIRDDVIREFLTGQGIPAEEQKLAAERKAERLRDHDWTRKFLEGNGEQRKEMLLIDLILNAPTKAAA
jgi:hypothetical protein